VVKAHVKILEFESSSYTYITSIYYTTKSFCSGNVHQQLVGIITCIMITGKLTLNKQLLYTLINVQQICLAYHRTRQHHMFMLYAFFWVISRRLQFICRRFGTLCLFHLHRKVDVSKILLTSTCLWRWNGQSVPKRRHINSRRRDITQKKAYNIQNTAKVWNQEPYFYLMTI
jgi:hypothetical protein